MLNIAWKIDYLFDPESYALVTHVLSCPKPWPCGGFQESFEYLLIVIINVILIDFLCAFAKINAVLIRKLSLPYEEEFSILLYISSEIWVRFYILWWSIKLHSLDDDWFILTNCAEVSLTGILTEVYYNLYLQVRILSEANFTWFGSSFQPWLNLSGFSSSNLLFEFDSLNCSRKTLANSKEKAMKSNKKNKNATTKSWP